ncbi:ABC transporter ATP-binding protein [Candidatus Microgenomates bacterium]|nr:ABC transporter ATP-binding protein [Candidatus Microgenomates bacterium]
MGDNIAIKIEGVSKTFWIPKEKRITLKDRFLSFYRRNNYEKFVALSDISFEVKKGESVGIVGPNGSGKSTLLKILAGIYAPDSGKVAVHGKIVSFLELGVGFNYELTGRENIYLNGVILGLKKKEIDTKFDSVVTFSGIDRRFLSTPIMHYSSGMIVRLAFAVAAHIEADIYVMDEVLAVGDVEFQEKSITFFREKLSLGRTLVFVSHDRNAVDKYTNRVLSLRNGRLVSVDNQNMTGGI